MGNEITFLREQYLYGAILSPLFAMAYMLVRGHKNKVLLQYFSHIKRVVRSVQMSLRVELFSYSLKGTGFLFLIFAISGPQYGKKRNQCKTKGN